MKAYPVAFNRLKARRTAMRQFFTIASRKIGWREFFLSRTVAWLLVGAVVLTALFKFALPLFVSTASVRTNMEDVLSSWTGARANIAGDPQISFWPHPVLTLRSVTFEGGDAAAPELLARADAIAAGFDILAALRGTPVFYDFHLINPVFKVERRLDGTFNWRRAGWMADAIADASGKSPSTARNTPIGDIEIVNGTLELTDHVTSSTHRVSTITGSVQWPTPATRMSTDLSALMNGEKVQWSVTCDEPLMLLSGRNSTFQTSFNSIPLAFSFDGNGNGSSHPFATGQLQLKAKSAGALLAWFKGDPLPPALTGSVAIDTSVTMSAQALKMDNLSLSLDDANATGVLGVAWDGARGPRIDGTLAFDRLDLTALFSSAFPLHQQPGPVNGPDMALLKQIRLDLRLSAQAASYGPTTVTDVAAGIMVENGRASIDIGDGTFAGGSISGRIALADAGAKGGQLQFALKNADLATVAASLGLTGPLPLGRGVLFVDLSTVEPLSKMTADGVSGEFRYSANNGTMVNFDVPEFERLATQGHVFNVSHAANGSFAFTRAEIVATLRKGVVELTTADISGEGRTLSLAGIIPFRNGKLALAGAIRPDDSPTSAVRFYVDGSWPSPVISPLPAVPAQP
ncbi:AsmA family protein [Pararhizobium sp. YC-54]|uniref:AsmA family protein n=1 Tax=Pararhizobium sp. YC-54 TaxID=2986920 RepID=UPI0021F76A52|nr:AsmA-like C-terminal region-containing protein [Pararhizobium sp. YC-54]MCV9998685.1 AsmA family protein [Pararhizobium sp. YC-54]